MIWISIILGIIEAIPSLIKLIQMIVDALHKHPLQLQLEPKFLGLLADWKNHQNGAKLEADLKQFQAQHSLT